MLAFLQVNASSYAQKVNIQVKDASINEVFYKLTQQTGHTFTADAALIKKLGRISLNMSNKTLKEVLEKCFAGHNVKMVFNDADKIVIIKSNNVNKITVQPSLTVTGKVTDEEGEPLAGVSIRVKNINTGVVSGTNGEYIIKVPTVNNVLIFSFLGFASQEVALGNRLTLNIRLKKSNFNLNETVVVAYGTVKRGDLTGSVGELKLSDVKQAPVGAFSEALAGRIAGVQVSSNEGQPGTLPVITIRGAGSLTQSSAPLYVVDGNPLEDFDAGSINTSDIESLTVLKDASATALYGARAANGVIVIETKKGREGKAQVNFDASAGIQEVRKFMEVMDPYEFVKYQEELYPVLAQNRYYTNGRDLEYYRSVEGADWQRQLLNTGNYQKYELAVRGGSKETKYSVSGAVYDQKGIIVNTDAQRYNGRISLDHTFNKKLSGGVIYTIANTKIGGIQSSVDNAGYRNFLFYSAWGFRPISGNSDIDFGDENIDDVFNPEDPSSDLRVNPVKNAKNTYRLRTQNNTTTSGYLTYKISDDLVFRSRANLITYADELEEFYNSKTVKGNLQTPLNSKGIQGGLGYLDVNTWSNDNTISYVKRLNKVHHISALGGFSLYSSKRKYHSVTYMNIPNEELGMSGIEEGAADESKAYRNNFTIVSFFGRFGYNYKSKYLFTGTFRADASSKFAKGNQWGYFPSAAFAWNMKQEPFLLGVNVVSNSKLRISYGATGNNRVSEFAYLPTLYLSQNAAYSYENGKPVHGLVPTDLGNKDLKWETTYQADIGYDLGLFKDRVSITADIYRKETHNLLLDADLPAITGYTKVYKNVGKLRNQGLELSLNSVNITNNNFKWETSFNISFNKNKVLELNDGQTKMFTSFPFETNFKSPLYVAEVGASAGMFYGYIWDGNYQYADFDQTAPGVYNLKPSVPDNGAARNDIQPGDIKYVDINKDGKINSLDMVHMGNGMPSHFGGFTNNFKYKNFDLSIFFQWTYGNKIFNANRVVLEGNTNAIVHLNQFASYADRWTPENQNNTYYRTNGQGPPGMYSTRTLEDGSYLRLKTMSLGYSLPESVIKPFKIRELRFVLSGQNLLTFTNYSGMDPEVSTRNSILTPGFDYSSYPHARTIVLGINASF